MSHQTQTLPARLLLPIPALSLLIATFDQWAIRRHSRRALTRLAAHQLRDIGLSTADATAESQKPFWRA